MMGRIHAFKPLDSGHITRVKKSEIVTAIENGKAVKFYKPILDCLEKCNETANVYNLQKHFYLKNPTKENHEKTETFYKEMNQAKIDLIRSHFFQMSKDEKIQAAKTIKEIDSYSFEYYHREWRRNVEDGGNWVKGEIYP